MRQSWIEKFLKDQERVLDRYVKHYLLNKI